MITARRMTVAALTFAALTLATLGLAVLPGVSVRPAGAQEAEMTKLRCRFYPGGDLFLFLAGRAMPAISRMKSWKSNS